jgi:hypothetical protein
MCHPCDMDAPVQGDTRRERRDLIGIWQHSALATGLTQFGACKSPLSGWPSGLLVWLRGCDLLKHVPVNCASMSNKLAGAKVPVHEKQSVPKDSGCKTPTRRMRDAIEKWDAKVAALVA